MVPKWHSEIDTFRKVKPCVILEGNILDQFTYPGDSFRKYLPEYLFQLFKEFGYKVVVLYNEARGFYAAVGGEEDIQTFLNLCDGISGLELRDNVVYCPFVGTEGSNEPTSEENETSEIKSIETANQSKTPVGIGNVISKVIDQAETSVAVIMDMASRYIVSPDRMDLSDVRAFSQLQLALRASAEAETNGDLSRNIVMLLVNKVNDLPTWFYLGNPDVKTINISTPDSQMRLDFVSGDNLKLFFNKKIFSEDIIQYRDNPDQLEKIQRRFVGLTEGFSYSDLIAMRTISYREGYRIHQLTDVVEYYRYGIRENKWASVNHEVVNQLQKDLSSNILGQKNALDKVMDVIKRSVFGLSGGAPNNRPKGVMFFAGPTGTGKTETAKALARNIFGDESCCIRFDMAEYKQSHSDQKLLGAPPGYVGYEAGGQLTNAVKNNPFSIILFDEIEKAHPSILDKFLQILDDGRLTDGQGNTVYFSESIIIFTSNKGILPISSSPMDLDNSFAINGPISNAKMTYKDMHTSVVEGIRKYFIEDLGRPELLNRIGEDNIVVYDYIHPDVAKDILDLHISKMKEDFKANRGIEVNTNNVEQVLLDRCCSDKVLAFGGRGIRNTVDSCLYTPLTRFLYDAQVVPSTENIRITIHSLDLDSTPVGITAEVNK